MPNRITDEQRREAIISQLSKKETMVLALALVYAENYYKYCVDVTKQWKNAVQQCDALSKAESYGYEKATENLKRQCEFCEYKNIIIRQRENDGEQG